MKKITTKLLAAALAFMTVFTMSDAFTVTAEAAVKSVVVNYNGSAKKSSVKNLSVSVDGNKAGSKATIYLTGTKKVKVNTVTTVNVKGKKKLKNANKVTYKSSKPDVATVSSKGVITAKKTGTTTITVTSKANAKKSYKVKLTVKKGIKSMKVDKSSISLKEGESADITATVSVDSKAKKVKTTISAASSDKNVAVVSVSGKKVTVSAIGEGEAIVTIVPKFGSAKAKSVKVTVEPVYKYTKVEFTNPNAKEVTLKGTLTFDNKADSDMVGDIETVLAGIGGDYEIAIGAKTLKVQNGKTKQDLSKLIKDGERTDVTVTCTKTINEMLTLASGKHFSKDVIYSGALKVSGLGDLTNIKITKDGKASVSIGSKNYTAFAVNGNLYLEGDQSDLAAAYSIIKDNNSVIKGFIPVKNY